MSLLTLINPVNLPGGLLWPGTTIDTVNDAARYAAAQAGGGVFFSATNSFIATAATLAGKVRQRAGDVEEAFQLMQSAATEAVQGGANQLPAPTAAGKLPYDTGAAFAETAAGTAHQVLHGAAGAPTWGAVDLTQDVTGLLPAANVDPAAGGVGVQVVQDAGTMVGGSLVVNTGITVRAGSKPLVTRNKPDGVPGHWGKLSAGTPVVGGPGTGSYTITSDNALDTSSVSLTIYG